MSELTRELGELAGQWIIKETTTTIPAAGLFQLTSANPNRWKLIIAVAAFGAATFVHLTTVPAAASPFGMQLDTGKTFTEFDYRRDGGLCQAAWFFNDAAANMNVTVIEVLLQQ